MAPNVPKIKVIRVDVDDIGLVIGSGGKTINGIKDDTGVEEISIEDDGRIFVSGEADAIEKAIESIEKITKKFVVGEKITAKVVSIRDFWGFCRYRRRRCTIACI